MINHRTVSTKIDHVLKVIVLPQCNPGLVPGSTTVLSRCRLVYPSFNTVKPGSVAIHPGGVPVYPGGATMFGGIKNDSNQGELGQLRDSTGVNRDAIGANLGSLGPNSYRRWSPGLCRNSPVSSWLSTVYA